MILKILIGTISFFLSFGLTLLFKPYIGGYIKSDIFIYIFQLLFIIVGFRVIYHVISNSILNRKAKH